MPRKRLTPETVYLPSRGINPDGNGINLRPDEAVDSVNLRYHAREVLKREGTRRLAKATPSGHPIIHLHTYKKPNGVEVLYGFTKNAVYKFTEGSPIGAWSVALPVTYTEACDATTNFSTDVSSGSVSLETATKMEGSGSLEVFSTSPGAYIADGVKIVRKHSITANMTTSKSMTLFAHYEATTSVAEDMQVRLQLFNTTDCSGSIIENITGTLAYVGGTNFAQAQFKFANPANLGAIRSWCLVTDGRWPDTGTSITTAFLFRVDMVQAIASHSYDVEFWDTTDIIDDAYGATVVAAGSNPPNPNEAEDDGASRALLYLHTDGTFKNLTLNHQIPVVNEDTEITMATGAHVIDTAGGDVANCNALQGAETIVAGSFSISTDIDGTIATSSSVLQPAVDSSGAAAAGYLLIPTDPTVVTMGLDSSWVKTTGEFQLTLLVGHTYTVGQKIQVNYTYLEDSQYKPRFVRSFHNRLLMGNIYEAKDTAYQTWRARWGAIGDITLARFQDYQEVVDVGVGPITKMEYLGHDLFIYKAKSKTRVRHIGGSSIFQFETVEKRGTEAGRTVVPFRGVHFYLGEDDVYIFDGSSSFSITLDNSTGNHRVRDTLFQRINNAKVNAHFGTFYEKYNEYWLFFVRGGKEDSSLTTEDQQELNPSMALVFNAQLGIFYFFEFNQISSVGHFRSNPGATWDSATSPWNTQGYTWESGTRDGQAQALVLARSTSDVYLMDGADAKDEGYVNGAGVFTEGSDIPYHLITRDFTWGDISLKSRTTRVDFECDGGVDTTVGYSLDYETDPSNFKSKDDISIDHRTIERSYFPDATGEHIRFLFEGTDEFRLRWVQPHAIIHDLPGE